jgi:hypothetical protein
VWAAEQAGESILSLASIILHTPVVLLTQTQLNEQAWARIVAACEEWEEGVRALGKAVPENGRIPHCKRISLDRTQYPKIQPKVDALLDSVGI